MIETRIIKPLIVCAVLLLASTVAWATHNRAGEIIYKRVNNNPFLYEISIITYTKTGGQSDAADRCELELDFGDGTSAIVSRDNGPQGNPCSPGVGKGVKIGSNTRYNVYTTRHEYPGAGTYKLSMQDPMRNAGVLNIKDSDNVPFYIESYLTIDILTGGNEAPTLRNPPIDEGCVGIPFYHNPGAVDPEGDSLVYSIVPSKSYGGGPISGYQLPNEVEPGPNNNLSIDPVSGTLTWDSPQLAGEYNVAILIEEYRRNPNNGQVFKVGSIMRDMQIDIGVCLPNDPPFIVLNEEVCVTAGDALVELIVGDDPNNHRLIMTAEGQPLDNDDNGFVLPDDTIAGEPELEMMFRWEPGCDHVRYAPYWMYFKAKEDKDGSVDLVDFKSMEITVNAPAVEITSITPVGTSLRVNWARATCDQGTGYDIYRYNDSLGYEPPDCLTGVPEALGYEFIGKTDDINETEFIDDNNGLGLVHGQRYCYMIVTRYKDGSESYPSAERCGLLVRDVPILNKVSVNITDSSNGTDSIAWFKPLDLRTELFGPPYRYRLSRSTSLSGGYEQVYLSESVQDVFTLDTVFVDEGLNTLQTQYYYKIELLSGQEEASVGAARSAASIYLSSEPGDNRLLLKWDVDVPWSNSYYLVYRFSNDPDSLDKMILLDTVYGATSYLDQGLANLKAYRYMVRAVGKYSAVDLSGDLINNSQIHTGIPVDVDAPCSPPDQFIDGDCTLEQTMITWSNPNEVCEGVDDVLGYKIYYAPVLGQPLEELTYINDPDETMFISEPGRSIAGCYAVVAVDSFGNESPWQQSLCVDNCPIYELPNVFTPGNDGVNDLFVPFPYKFVESIDLAVFNRWGVQVFSTTDPDVNWDGTDQRSGKPLPSGVYYYVCTVNEIRLTGIVPREIRGDVHLLRETRNQPLAP